ncbi:hypothetical protein ABC345_01425 [Shouchella sp. 1P09AA]|uniref:hypothetical protein n=1 Tax=unclassified Shouchella TaxID=2893065 RepID=UPI00399F3D7A
MKVYFGAYLFFLFVFLSGCTGIEKVAQIGDSLDDFESVYGDFELDESQGFPTAFFPSGHLHVEFNAFDEEYKARAVNGKITSHESIEEALSEIKELFIPKEFEYMGPNCNNQIVAELHGEKTDIPSFYFVEEDQLAIEVSLNTIDGDISERVRVEEIGSIGEVRYACEIDVDESIEVGDI